MTSMRMRLLFSLSFVHVLVRYIGGEGEWGGGGGGGVMTSMRMRLLFSLSFVHVLVRYICESHFCVLFLCLMLSAVLLLLGHKPRRHA